MSEYLNRRDYLQVDNTLPKEGLEANFVNSNFIIEEIYSSEDEGRDTKSNITTVESSADEECRSVLQTQREPLSVTVPKSQRLISTIVTTFAKAFDLKSFQWLQKKKIKATLSGTPIPEHRIQTPQHTTPPPPKRIKTDRLHRFSKDEVKDTLSFHDRTDAFSINSNESIIHRETDSKEREECRLLLMEFHVMLEQTKGEQGLDADIQNRSKIHPNFQSGNPFRQQSYVNPWPNGARLTPFRTKKPQEREPPKETAGSKRLQQCYLHLYPDTIPVNNPNTPLSFPRNSCIPNGCTSDRFGIGSSEQMVKRIKMQKEEQKRRHEFLKKNQKAVTPKSGPETLTASGNTREEPDNSLNPYRFKSLFNMKRWLEKGDREEKDMDEVDPPEKIGLLTERSGSTSRSTTSDHPTPEPDTRDTSPDTSENVPEKTNLYPSEDKRLDDIKTEEDIYEEKTEEMIRASMSFFDWLFPKPEKVSKQVSERMFAKSVPEDFDDDIPLKPEILREMNELSLAAQILSKKELGVDTPTLLSIKPVGPQYEFREFKSSFPFSPQMIGPASGKDTKSEDKKYNRVKKDLTAIMRSQKMYINRDKVSDFHPEWKSRADDVFRYTACPLPFSKSYHFCSTAELREPTSGHTYQVARGDGNTRNEFEGKEHIRFNILLKQPHGENHNWKREIFEPLFIYPNLVNMANSPVNSATANILPYTLHLMSEDYLRDYARMTIEDIYRVDRNSSLTIRDLFSWKPNMSYTLSWKAQKFGGAVMQFVGKKYINPFQKSHSVRYEKQRSEVSTHPLTSLSGTIYLDISTVINNEVSKFVDIVAIAYVQAFMQLSDYRTIGIHSSERAYVYAYDFFINQRVIDFGWLLLKFLKISPSDLDSERFPVGMPYSDQLKKEFPDSLSLMLDSLDKRGTLNEYSKRTIIIAICILKSPCIFKFILRTLLFFVDARSANTFEEYHQNMGRHAQDVQLKALSRKQRGKYITHRVIPGSNMIFERFPVAQSQSFTCAENKERERRFIDSMIRVVRGVIVKENS